MTDQAQQKATAETGNPIARILLAQLGLGMVLTMLFWGMDGRVSGYSALLGSLASVIPNAFLALRLAMSRPDQGAKSLLRAAYVGELGKLALTVLIFSLVFTLVRPIAAGPLFTGFIGTTLMAFAGFLQRNKSQDEVKSTNNGE